MSNDLTPKDAGCGCALAGIVLALLVAIGLPVKYALSNLETSSGYRDSTVRKFSQSGWLFKTYEVEALGDGMRLKTSGNAARAEPETFTYSVSDPAIVEKLQKLPPAKRVRIKYKKYATSWFTKGETSFFITDVETLP